MTILSRPRVQDPTDVCVYISADIEFDGRRLNFANKEYVLGLPFKLFDELNSATPTTLGLNIQDQSTQDQLMVGIASTTLCIFTPK